MVSEQVLKVYLVICLLESLVAGISIQAKMVQQSWGRVAMAVPVDDMIN